MLNYHIAYWLPCDGVRMVVAEALDFPGVMSQGFDLADARVMVASALEDMAKSSSRKASRCRYQPRKPSPKPRRART